MHSFCLAGNMDTDRVFPSISTSKITRIKPAKIPEGVMPTPAFLLFDKEKPWCKVRVPISYVSCETEIPSLPQTKKISWCDVTLFLRKKKIPWNVGLCLKLNQDPWVWCTFKYHLIFDNVEGNYSASKYPMNTMVKQKKSSNLSLSFP